MSVLVKELSKCLNPETKINILDVGAIGDTEKKRWALLGSKISLHGFEPAEKAFGDLKKGEINSKYYNIGLSDKSGIQKFYIYNHATINSLLPQKKEVLERYTIYPKKYKKDALIPLEKTVEINTLSLDDWKLEYNVGEIDFINLDCESIELSVLKSGETVLKDCLALLVDTTFFTVNERGSRFLELYNYLNSMGFELFDFSKIQKCGFVNSPVTDWRYTIDNKTIRRYGRLFCADLLFVRDPFIKSQKYEFTEEKLLKLACISEIYDQTEFSFEILANLATKQKRYEKAFVYSSRKYKFNDSMIYKLIRIFDSLSDNYPFYILKKIFSKMMSFLKK